MTQAAAPLLLLPGLTNDERVWQEVKGTLQTGAQDVAVGDLRNGDTMQAKVEQKTIEYVLPKEGASIWTDSLVIPKSAPHKRAAHAFMEYVLRPDVAVTIADFTGYGTPVEAASAKLASPVPYPSADEMKRLEFQKDLGKANDLWDQLWTEIKSA